MRVCACVCVCFASSRSGEISGILHPIHEMRIPAHWSVIHSMVHGIGGLRSAAERGKTTRGKVWCVYLSVWWCEQKSSGSVIQRRLHIVVQSLWFPQLLTTTRCSFLRCITPCKAPRRKEPVCLLHDDNGWRQQSVNTQSPSAVEFYFCDLRADPCTARCVWVCFIFIVWRRAVFRAVHPLLPNGIAQQVHSLSTLFHNFASTSRV